MPRLMLRSTALAIVASLALAASAAATVPFKPFRVPIGMPDPWVQPANTGYCSFDLYVEFTPSNVVLTVTSRPDGSYVVTYTGRAAMRFTDLANGHSGIWQTPAALVQVYDANGDLLAYYSDGPAIAYGPLPPIQDSGVYQYNGHADYLAGTWTGTRVDICAALAG